ncbi:transporter substrate-binding domain-containing protein [Campylobacter sp. FMV-PI01]|uniref:Transporter substrate-binding domain-containing protein n=1 Tax=Campylobacter portucalensis TaxID=2608384 RepID=A0A6L5WL65_9BACT|nr:transporter substrate-binding domain-containing protein [Campylobacter portucalensis]MSN96573.1 transporter substrate-binding domain-containing protein [Campylobacter portucalensis]
MNKICLALALTSSFLIANSLEQIRKDKVLRVGVHAARPPFSNLENGNLDGFEIQLGKALGDAIFEGDKNGGSVKFITFDLNQRINALVDNKVDIMLGSFSITEDRSKIIDFSMPYLSVNLAVLTNKKSNIKNLSQLRDKIIGVEKSSTADIFFSSKGYKIDYCGNTTQCYQKVKSGEIDGFADNNTAVLVYEILDSSVEVGVLNAGPAAFIGVGVQKGNNELLDFINKQIIFLNKSGFFRNAYEQTFVPFYKGKADKKYFLLDELYKFL